MLAAALRDIGMVVDAGPHARQETVVGPDMPEVRFMLGCIIPRQTLHEEAVEHYGKAIALVSD